MGQKVSPHALRVGVIQDWDSKWYAGKNDFADYLVEDNKVRTFVKKKLYAAGVSKVVIERAANNQIKVIVLVNRPGMVIGREGNGIDEIKAAVAKMTGKEAFIEVKEIKRAELDAQLTAESIAQSLERRVSFRRAMKQAMGRTMKSGAKGIKILVSGRVGGAEIARSEKYAEGNVPLHTIRADIDYGFAEADTTYGKLGIKVWINHGEILDKGLKSAVPEDKPERRERRNGDRRNNRGDRRNGDRRDRRDRNEAREEAPKPAYSRVRKTPKVAPAQEAPVEPQVEAEAPEASAEA